MNYYRKKSKESKSAKLKPRWARAPSKLPGSLCATFLGREVGKLGSNNISMRCRDRPVSTKPNDDVVRLIVDLAPIL